jgi:FtsP/CotA-like multicopper oxidase with cupredoxin domain
MDFTGPAVYRGLLGLHLVRDAVEDALPLPRGDREIPLVLCDRSFDADGQFAYPSLDRSLRRVPGVEDEWREGVLGDVVLVNGAPWPIAEVDAARHRLRILNGANARRFSLAFRGPNGPDLPVTQIGSDGGLLAAPLERPTVDLAPGERCDVVVDLGRVPVGTEVTVVNLLGTGSTRDVLRFRVVRAARDDSTVPAVLSEIEPLVPGPVRREFVFRRGAVGDHAGWTINDGDLALPHGRPPSRARAPRPRSGARARRPRPRAVRRRVEGHGGPAAGGDRGRRGAVHRSRGPVRAALPQPRARGHGDDGDDQDRRAYGRSVSPPGCIRRTVVTRCRYPCTVWIPLLRSA